MYNIYNNKYPDVDKYIVLCICMFINQAYTYDFIMFIDRHLTLSLFT